MKRCKTDYPGVFYRDVKRIGGKETERVYYILFKKDGVLHEEKVGRQYADDMTPARANSIRAERIEGKRRPRKEIREAAAVVKWTVDRCGKNTTRAGGQTAGGMRTTLKRLLVGKNPTTYPRLISTG